MKHFFIIIVSFFTLILLSENLMAFYHQDTEVTANIFMDFEDESNNCNDDENIIANIFIDSDFSFQVFLEKSIHFLAQYKDKILNIFIRIEVPPPSNIFSLNI
jgi:hypothetical protein